MTDFRACEAPDCEVEFEPQTDNQRYHSPACSKRAEKARARERKRAERIATSPVPKSAQGKLTSAERQERMAALIACDGSPTKASALLADQGVEVSRHALQDLKSRRSDEYLRMRDELMPRIKAAREEAHASLASKAAHLTEKVLDKVEGNLDEFTNTELNTAVQRLSTVSGIHEDKAAMLRGEGTVVQHTTINVGEMLKTMRTRWPQLFPTAIDSTATEIQEAAPQDSPERPPNGS